jgi:hypothetical protein
VECTDPVDAVLAAEAEFKKKLAEAPVIDAVQQRKEFLGQVADHYNAASPREQRRMDQGLQRLKAQRVAHPYALFSLFPSLGKKPIKLKQQ